MTFFFAQRVQRINTLPFPVGSARSPMVSNRVSILIGVTEKLSSCMCPKLLSTLTRDV